MKIRYYRFYVFTILIIFFFSAFCGHAITMAATATAQATATIVSNYQKLNVIDNDSLHSFSRNNINNRESVLITDAVSMEIDTNSSWSIGISQVKGDGESPVMLLNPAHTSSAQRLTDIITAAYLDNQINKISWDLVVDSRHFKDNIKNLYEMKLEIILIAQ